MLKSPEMTLTRLILRHFEHDVKHAREKHPRWVTSRLHYTAVLLEEVGEHLWHVWRGNRAHAETEGGHVVAVIVRGIAEGFGEDGR